VVAEELDREVVRRLDRNRGRETDSVADAAVLEVEFLANVPVDLHSGDAPRRIHLEKKEQIRPLEDLSPDAARGKVQLDVADEVPFALEDDPR
jgi:hypothetical protein